MSDINKIEIRSEEVQDIMGAPPSWIIRRGITFVVLGVLALLVGSYFYKYPDIIDASITVLSENPPVQIVARTNGKLIELFVHDRQTVNSNTILGIIENPANYNDVYELTHILDSIQPLFQNPELLKDFSFKKEYCLGEYHSYYSSFVSQLKNYQTFLYYNLCNQKIQTLQEQVYDYQNYIEKLDEQFNTLKENYELKYKNFHRDSIMHNKKVIADLEYEESKASLLQAKYSYQSDETDCVNARISMNQLRKEIEEQKISMIESENNMQSALKERYDNLLNQLKDWEQNYVLKTPIEGKVAFTNFWCKNQFISIGDIVFSVVPDKKQKIIGRASLPVEGAGKINQGQKVNIKLNNYPYFEFGILEGKVSQISMIPVNTEQESYYIVEINLPNKLVTNYKKDIPFNQNMQGTAEIITKDRRLIERLIEPLFSIFRKNINM